jgi:(p)ppGpp synthase/HD superfamily hydrolase
MPSYSRRLDDALALAADAFRDHERKASGVPYLTHLLSVCALVGEHGGDEDQMIAALLHDYLEDVDGEAGPMLTARFGPRVAQIVGALSDTLETPKPPWQARKDAYLALLRDEPAEIKLVSAADKLHNCRSVIRDHHAVGDAVFDRFTAGKVGTLWYYRAVTDALAAGWAHPILVELREAVSDLHRLAETPI